MAANPRNLILVICYIGFVSLGLPDALLGVAWPSIRDHFNLRHGEMSWLLFGAGLSYSVSSFFAGRLLNRMNAGLLLAGSSALVALSGFDYGLAPIWMLFAAGSLFHGLGSGAIDSALNHYVATHFSARHMNWLHACYSLGAMIGPALMTAMITHAGSWRAGYLSVAATLLLLSILFFATNSRWTGDKSRAANPASETQPSAVVTTGEALRNRTVWLHIILFFIYTGLEVAVGQWSYTILTESRGVPAETAGIWVTLYWGSILAGRIIFGFGADRVGIDRLIRLSAMTALLGTALFLSAPAAAPVALALAGLGLAVIFPSLMTRTPQRLGPAMAGHAIGFQVGAAMLGAAAIPSVAGLVGQYAGLARIPLLLFGLALTFFVLHEAVVRAAKPQPALAGN